MLNWLRRLIAPPKIVEVDLNRPILNSDARTSLAELRGHPGLTYIVSRIRLQRWYLENQLRSGTFPSMREFDQVQSGVRWTAWIERQIEETINADTAQPRNPNTEELEAFAKAQSALELVGQNQ